MEDNNNLKKKTRRKKTLFQKILWRLRTPSPTPRFTFRARPFHFSVAPLLRKFHFYVVQLSVRNM